MLEAGNKVLVGANKVLVGGNRVLVGGKSVLVSKRVLVSRNGVLVGRIESWWVEMGADESRRMAGGRKRVVVVENRCC